MGIFKKSKTQKNPQPIPEQFTQPPISGGNSFSMNEYLNAKEANIHLFKERNVQSLDSFTSRITAELDAQSINNTYNYWFILNFMADYFSNIVPFRFKDVNIQRAVMIAIRLGVIYGQSALWWNDNKLAGMYINNLEHDEMGYPKVLDLASGVSLLLTQSKQYDGTTEFKGYEDLKVVPKEVDDNIFTFLPYNYRVGGLINWRPFLLTFERLLKMVYTNSFQYAKSFTYRVNDVQMAYDEIKMFFNNENPFLIEVGNDDTPLANRINKIEIGDSGSSYNLFTFIKDYLNLFYELIGRRENTDKKNERNIKGEVQASQNNFDVLQNELTNSIHYLLEWVKEKTGQEYEILNEMPEEPQDDQEGAESDNGTIDTEGSVEDDV